MNAAAPLRIVKRDRVVYARATRPTPAGAPSSRLAELLLDLCLELRETLDAPAALALANDGPHFFVEPPASAAEHDQSAQLWSEAIAALSELALPTVACLSGNASGTACELALACDFRLTDARVRLGFPDIRFARLPSCGGTQRLTRLVGRGRALEMLLLGELLDASAARDAGLVHRLADAGTLEASLEGLLQPLRQAAPISLAYAKEAVRAGTDLSLEEGLRLEADLATLLHTTRDRAEGISAFLERREPRFEGC